MGRSEVRESIDVVAPLEFVFERITDHEAMSAWPGIQACELVREGQPRNGLGALRRIRALGLTLLEEIVAFEPPHRFDYRIIRGLPVDHHATIRLSARADVVAVDWSIRLASRWPLVSEATGALLRRGLPGALAYFKRETERRAAAG
jgi:hypothetical protein